MDSQHDNHQELQCILVPEVLNHKENHQETVPLSPERTCV